MDKLRLKNGNTASIVQNAYAIASAMDKARDPAMKVQMLAFTVSVLSEELGINLLELGDNIKREMSKIEPVQLKAYKAYVREEIVR